MQRKINIIIALFTFITVSSTALEWEVGFGSNSGGILGITANHTVTNDVEVYGGLALIGGVLGTRYYINENIRFNINYGVNGYGNKDKNWNNYLLIYHGFNLGLDYIWNNGFNLGITVALSQNAYYTNKSKISSTAYSEMKRSFDDDSKPNIIGISIGYRF